MAEVSSKASPLHPHHCYRVVTLNVSEVQIGESNSSRRACVLLFFFFFFARVVCAGGRGWKLQGWMMDTEDHISARLEANSCDQAS